MECGSRVVSFGFLHVRWDRRPSILHVPLFYLQVGIVNGFGVFQTYLLQHQLVGYTQDAVAWIGSLQIFISFFGGLFSGRYIMHGKNSESRLCDTYGPRWLLIGGSVSYLLSLFMTALCTEYWQFFLAQGVLTGLGSGMTYIHNVRC